MRFLRNVLATIVGLVVFFGLIIMVFAIIGAASEQEVEVEANSVLRLELNKPIVERDTEDPFSSILLPGTNGVIGLINLREAIKKAKNDENIKGIYLDAGMLTTGYGTMEEIRNDLLDFKESGKFIVSYSDIVGERGYYLNSVADEVYINPQGIIEFNGFAVEVTFIKNTLEKLGVEPQVFRVGDFKSAVEPLTRTSLSDSARLQTQEYLGNLYEVYLQGIAETRGLEVATLRNIADSMKVRFAGDAVQYGLATDTAYYDQVLNVIGEKLGLEADENGTIDTDNINFISLKKYEQSLENEPDEYSRNRVAVIVATGNIVNGEGEGEVIGGETFAKEIRKARLDDNIKAIVIRINSAGGSALASDIMWREIQLAKEVKPVIASMSDVAASGGYYMAMGCDTIVAHPNTITGSIGILGVIPNVEELLNKIGVTTDVVQTGQFSDIYNLTGPLSEFEQQIIQNQIEEGYETFTRKAAAGRNMPLEQLLRVASGRVWSGIEAKDRNLIDVFGGLDQAIEIAVEKAKLEEGDYQVRYYPKKKTFIEELIAELENQTSTYFLKRELGLTYPYVMKLKELEQYRGVQARMPFEIEIK
ncbi:MAG: signal peptide peptidase SppA [Cyclobacteriaceae bacterium]